MKRRILLALLGVCLALSAAEVIARACYRAPWYDQLIGEQEREPRPIARNSYGLRGPDYAYEKPPAVRRVFVIGDSFTAGSWVPDEHVFTRLLETRFNQEQPVPGVARYEFLNGGVAATLTHDWVELYQRVAPFFDPDLLLIVFFLRDGTLLAAKSDFMGPIREEYAQRHARSLSYQYSYLYRSLRDRWDKDEILALYGARFRDSYFGDEQATAEWRRAQVNLCKLCDLAQGSGVRVGFVIFPMLVYLDEPHYPFQEIVQALQGFALSASLPSHDLLPSYRDQDPRELWLSALNQHPNPLGHKIAAESLYPFVLDLLRSD